MHFVVEGKVFINIDTYDSWGFEIEEFGGIYHLGLWTKKNGSIWGNRFYRGVNQKKANELMELVESFVIEKFESCRLLDLEAIAKNLERQIEQPESQ